MKRAAPNIPCHCSALRRAARIITELYDRDLASAGLTLPQFSLLRRLERAGPSSLTRLAEVVHLERTTLGRNLRPLEDAGLIESRASEADARVRVIALSELGEATLARAMPMWRRAQQRLEGGLGADRVALLRGLLADLDTLRS